MTGGPTNASCSNFSCFVFRARFLIMLYKCILKQMATTFLERIQSTQQETNCFELCNRLVIKILTSRRDWVIIVQKNDQIYDLSDKQILTSNCRNSKFTIRFYHFVWWRNWENL
jgi:hypothetical protein